MLVLARRVGEQVVIDGNIRVTVLAIKNQRVRLGISAPATVTVDRAELHERKCQGQAWEEAAAPEAELVPE